MGSDSVEFDWEYEPIPGGGRMFRPYVPIQLKSRDSVWRSYWFLADTGADVSMLPYSLADTLGIDVAQLTPDQATGIGGYTIDTWLTKIPIRLGDWQLTIQVVFTSDNLTPLLLGRIDTLERRFSWIFDHRRRQIVFTKKP